MQEVSMEQKENMLRMLLWQSGKLDSREFDAHRKFIFWVFALGLTSISLNFRRNTENFLGLSVSGQDIFEVLRMLSVIAVFADLALYIILHKFRRVHRAVKVFILGTGVLMSFTDLFTLYYWRTAFKSQMLDIVLVSNFNEGFEFLESYLTDYGFLLFVAAVAATLFILYRLRKAMLVFIVIMITVSIQEILMYPQIFTTFYFTPSNANYLGIGRIALMTQEVREKMLKYKVLLDAKPQEVTLTRNDSSIPHTVFILGEATARHHMSLYGYDLPTTPNLLRRKHEGGLYVFSNVVSPHSYTIIVLEKLFNFYRYCEKGEWFTYTNLFSILRAAGCHTVWLSNQEVRPYYDPTTVYSGVCDYSGYVEAKYNWDSGKAYDAELLPLLDNALKESTGKNFYVVHLMGCHNTYSRRYPPEYAKFTASDETGGYDGITESQKAHRAEYDNAELYNDYVVDEIIRRFEDKNAIVIYVSDHGQEVYDEVNFASHGGERPYRHIIEVPFVIWTSPKFRESYPELEARIASSVNRPYMTDDMIHTVLDIMGIETPEYDPAKSIINPNFDSSRKRIYAGMQYDKDTGLHEIQ